ncbi:DNRLRE domain-containing protein [bacterium]|nr:DNRLRE domain-containing protein [bacterium]
MTSEPTLGGETIDLYTENLEAANRQVKFMRNGEVLHKLRPVDAYAIDEKGERIVFRSDGKTPDNMVRMRTAQVWQLRQNQPGIAELSVSMEDVINAPEGDLVIDPTKDFGGGYFTDTVLNEISGENNFESSSYLELGNYYEEKRILIGVDIGDGDEWDDGFYNVEKAEIKLYVYNTYNVSDDHDAVFYKMTEDWDPSDVCWDDDGEGTNWDGGDYTTSVRGEYTTLPTSASWVFFDITDVYKSLFYASPGDVLNPGMILVGYNLPTNPAPLWSFYSADYTSYRPELELTYPSNVERLLISGLSEPYSDCFPIPSHFNGKWYINFISCVGDNGAVCVVEMPTALQDGLATDDLDDISHNLLRVPVPTDTPSPMSSGTPYPGFIAPYPQFTPIPTTLAENAWYGRMAGICGKYSETNAQATPIKIHGYFHAEDNHDFDGSSYGTVPTWAPGYGLHINYARIGYAVSTNGINYDQKDGSASSAGKTGPVIISYMSEREWRFPPYGTPVPTATPGGVSPTPTYLEHGPGVGNPWVIERNGYLYMFYTRMDTYRYTYPMIYPGDYLPQGYPTPNPTSVENLKKSLKYTYLTPTPNGDPYIVYPKNQTLCLARASVSNVKNYNPSSGNNPWKKYFADGVSDHCDDFTELANGGWSSPLLNVQRECASVTYNDYLDEYTMLCGGYCAGPYNLLYIYISSNSTFTDWSEGLRLDVYSSCQERPTYGFFVNTDSGLGREGSVVICGQNPFLYYLPAGSNKRTSRISFEFIE